MKQLQERLTQKYPPTAAEWAVEHAQYALGLASADDIPPSLNDDDTAKVLGVKSNTIKVWRCTGDREIQFSKTGRSAANSTLSVLQLLIESGRAVA
jgi:hypothetical protein